MSLWFIISSAINSKLGQIGNNLSPKVYMLIIYILRVVCPYILDDPLECNGGSRPNWRVGTVTLVWNLPTT